MAVFIKKQKKMNILMNGEDQLEEVEFNEDNRKLLKELKFLFPKINESLILKN